MTPDITKNSKRWQVAPAIPPAVLQETASLHPIIAQILVNRGIGTYDEMRAFLESRYFGKDDPFLLADMDVAVARILQALDNDESVSYTHLTLPTILLV